jgi:5-methylcytosine-specific restriction endonuclease McrA
MSTPGATYGVRKDGTLGICRAKPENQGKGRCFHGQHIFVSAEDLKLNIVQRHNEEIMQTLYASPQLAKGAIPSGVTQSNIQSHVGGGVLSKQQLEAGAVKVAESFRETDWNFIKEFYAKYDRVLNDEERADMFKENPADNIADYLESDDPAAKKLRNFLGDGINVNEFSEILVQQVGAMTNIKIWSPKGGNSVRRSFLSALNNDMTKERYVASVIFFGGRCCYCNRTLRKNPPPDRQASGEHITPITPEDKRDISGGTRYGNMALACMGCNHDRGNKKLVDWISKTSCIKKENRENVLGRIKAFREFALYNEYTPAENKKINGAINEIQRYINTKRGPDGSITQPGISLDVNNKMKIAVFDLQHGA